MFTIASIGRERSASHGLLQHTVLNDPDDSIRRHACGQKGLKNGRDEVLLTHGQVSDRNQFVTEAKVRIYLLHELFHLFREGLNRRFFVLVVVGHVD
jgi:hypothetical protein